MLKENLSLTQLLALLVNFLLGSAIVIGVGTEAKNDAWIAISAGSVCGVGILFFYLFFMSRLPGKNLFEIMEFCIGRKLSILLSFIYITYFLYTSSRIIRDFGELMASAIMPNTPIELISLSITMVIGYILYLGIEVLAALPRYLHPIFLAFYFY
ncbi:GerAB/ArcD/ProY family transporter [Neobacillus sp. PS3-34]|uniref:GerAB/ArcD/ProY family transporter n=1 Tax=Neobacillus sp. PS3-34 TaxID=3070678 RepID=UPI0027E0C296|nr:GerAB/ArcD/ProY family transporter [Neobacillus sp. PS3-34]WML49487.1 GerAB/ArcD/ProY family transporter [Neobacillus sp. PS3-34]